MVVASAVNDEGEEIYPRKWNHEFIDMPVVEEEKQNTPTFSSDVMTGLARWKKERERMIFVMCGAGGFRVGEALGVEIDKHISPDFLTIFVQQKIHHGRLEPRLKTANGFRQVDLTRRLLLFSKNSLATEHQASCSVLDKGNPSLRQTSSAAICTRPLRNWATSIRSPERIKLGTMRFGVSETLSCGTTPTAPKVSTSTGWDMQARI
jgi:hypothetical protein